MPHDSAMWPSNKSNACDKNPAASKYKQTAIEREREILGASSAHAHRNTQSDLFILLITAESKFCGCAPAYDAVSHFEKCPKTCFFRSEVLWSSPLKETCFEHFPNCDPHAQSDLFILLSRTVSAKIKRSVGVC